ncbi:TIGR03086 family protein [Streptomyces sp. NA02950]|nr:TIGR03086 family protein [Streptomyces sp. NA02950]
MERFLLSGAEFEQRLRAVRSAQWTWPTPCTEWNVRQLVNHVVRGNLNYVGLLDGGTGAEFLRSRDADALGTDAVGAYVRSLQLCAEAFAAPGALNRVLDYPLGKLTGERALGVKLTDITMHTWDLARAVGADEHLHSGLVAWISDHLDEIYAGLPETPADVNTSHRFFAAPGAAPAAHESVQDRLLRRMGRTPGAIAERG